MNRYLINLVVEIAKAIKISSEIKLVLNTIESKSVRKFDNKMDLIFMQ